MVTFRSSKCVRCYTNVDKARADTHPPVHTHVLLDSPGIFSASNSDTVSSPLRHLSRSAQSPAEEKYRKVRLTNEKISPLLVEVKGAKVWNRPDNTARTLTLRRTLHLLIVTVVLSLTISDLGVFRKL